MASAQRPKVAVRVVRADGGPEALVPIRGDVLLAGRTGDLASPKKKAAVRAIEAPARFSSSNKPKRAKTS